MFQIVEDFKISLIEDGKSPKTIESYIEDIIKYLKSFLTSKEVEFNAILQ